MLKIIPVQDKPRQAALCALCGISNMPRSFCYEITVDEKTVGVCLFSLRGKTASLDSLCNTPDSTDEDALFIAGRQALNFSELAGAEDATAEPALSPALLRRIGFREAEDGTYRMHIKNFFFSPCQHPSKPE